MKEVVYRRTGLSWFYNLIVVFFVLLGLLFLMVALGSAVEARPWADKWISVVIGTFAGLSWLLGAPSMWSLGKGYRRNVARLDSLRFSLHTPAGQDLQFAFADVRQVTWYARLRSRLCVVRTDSETYEFDTRACPHVHRIARLIAERSGQTLQIENS